MTLCGEQVRCATYRVYVRDRTTGQPVEGCDFTEQAAFGKWTRKQHNAVNSFEPSTAEVELNTAGVDPSCCACLPVPWRDELVVERLDRTGSFEETVWVGPIWNVLDDSVFGTLQIKAKDRSSWPLERQQIVTEGKKFENVDQSEVFMWLWNHLDAKNPSGLVPFPQPTGETVSIEFEPNTATADILAVLPDVYWSIHGDLMYGPGPVDLGHGEAARVNLDVGSHWEDQGAVVDYNGRNTATCVLVRNTGTPAVVDLNAAEQDAAAGLPARDASGQFTTVEAADDPEATEIALPDAIEAWWPQPCTPHPIYGQHCIVHVDESIETEAEAQQIAFEIYEADFDGDAFLVTSAGTLSREAPIAVCDLLVGRTFGVTATSGCSDLETELRLNNVVVNFQAEETGRGVQLVESRVATDLQPLSNTRTSESRLSI